MPTTKKQTEELEICDPGFPVLLNGTVSNDSDAWNLALFLCSDHSLDLVDALNLISWAMTRISRAQA
jgi:hypothetical protein